MSLMTSWLTREQGDYDMGDDDIPHIPKTAAIPFAPKGRAEMPVPEQFANMKPTMISPLGPPEARASVVPRTPLPEVTPAATDLDVVNATGIVDTAINGLQKRNVVLEDQLTALEADLRNKGTRLADAELKLLDAEQRNSNLETKCEDLRQENSDLRAKFSALIALLREYENGPLPRRVKNGKPKGD